jgi:hypothetical protein
MTTSRFVSSAALVATLVTTSPGHSAAATPTGSAIAVPILMYHVIGDPRADAPLPELYVSEADFTGQMRGSLATGTRQSPSAQCGTTGTGDERCRRSRS